MKRTLLVLLVVLVTGACGGGGGGGAPPPGGGPPSTPTGAASGRIQFFAATPGLLLDAEPNDAVDGAQDLGSLPRGGRVTILGEVDASADPLDGYRLRAPHRARLRVELRAQDAGGADLELSLFEPVSMQTVEIAPEAATPTLLAHVRGVVHVVVRARAGAARYEVRVVVDPPQVPLDEAEPNDPDGEAGFLGALAPGDALRLEGDASATGDVADAWLLLVTEDLSLDLSLEHPAFTDFEVEALDATADLLSPLPLAAFGDAPTSPQEGRVDLDAPTLLLLVVHARAGQGPWRLDLEADPRVSTTTALRAAPRPFAARDREARRLRLGAGERRYGVARDDVFAGTLVVPADAVPETRGVGRLLEGEGPYRRIALDVPADLDDEDRRRFTLSRAALLAARGDGWVEPDRLVRALREPDDTYYGYQWHYEQIGLPAAWDVTTGSSDVTVAVIDTGQTNHPDLVGRQVQGYDFISNAAIAGDGDGIDGDPTDVGDGGGSGLNSWHGTHVAGTIGASTNDGRGVAGVSWGARIMHLRALGIGGGSVFDISNAIRYAARLSNSSGTLPAQRADVINLSLGSSSFSTTMRDACDAAKGAGVVIVAAAGNSSSTSPFYPAAYESVISVVAVDASKTLAPYSNSGTTVDLAAPGGNLRADVTGDGYADGVLSTLWDDSTSPMTPVYAFYQGTSMAAPHVAGVAALVLSLDPTLTPDEVQTLLQDTAEDLGALGRDATYGWGLVDAFAAVSTLRPDEPQGPPVLALSPTLLNFGAALSTLGVGIRNTGGGLLEVEEVTATTESGGSWISVTTLSSSDPATDTAGLRVQVTRAGLLPGTYLGRIEVVTNAGTASVAVAMAVELDLPPPPNLDIHVIAVDAASGQIVQRTTVNPQGSLSFSFPVLPVGEYLFFAGTDFDGDGELGETGDYFGAWPREGEPQSVTIIQQGDVPNLDFAVLFSGALGLEAAPR